MKASRRTFLPLLPLLRAYVSAGVPSMAQLNTLPGLGARFRAIAAARQTWLSPAFVDSASETEFQRAVSGFYQSCVPYAPHVDTVRRRAGLVRHGVAHLLRGRGPLGHKVGRYLDAGGTYHIVGLGPSFWSAVFLALEPDSYPAWLSLTPRALERLGQPVDMARASERYAACRRFCDHVRQLEPALSQAHVDHFLCLAAVMHGRDLATASAALEADLTQTAAVVSANLEVYVRARRQLEDGLAVQQGEPMAEALASIGVAGAQLDRIDWLTDAEELTLWIGRLWEADDPWEVLERFWKSDPIAGAGLWLPAAILHLKDPARFSTWDEAARAHWGRLDDAAETATSATEAYRLFNEAASRIPEYRPSIGDPPSRGDFGGFSTDTFRFLAELEEHNQRAWMETQRERYRFAVRGPLVELCRALANRYVVPVLRRQYGWDIETAACNGRALTSICKNNYGRSAPYASVLWITFYPRTVDHVGPRREDVQFFVRLNRTGLQYGFRLGPDALEAGRRFRAGLTESAASLYELLQRRGVLADCSFMSAEESCSVANPAELQRWALGRSLVVAHTVDAADPLLRSEELVGHILLTFDRLLPLFALAAETDPRPLLNRWAGAPVRPCFTAADFQSATFLSGDWLDQARSLLELKRQLILQGVPGTGKTHVARCLARLLTNGREDAIRLVQFHPAYSYEEFVEGIKARSVEINGRCEVTYPIEDGVLCAFAAEAARQPGQPFVLIIDEINRGNLPRILGEMLYLLEYRDQSVQLPYSKRELRLPANLYLIGTMNAADRSVALVDQALRRRFSFIEMPPDRDVLAQWFQTHPPTAGKDFAGSVVGLLDRLNARLRSEAGPHCQVGHSYFMAPRLDADRLGTIWRHQVEPLLEEYFAGQADRTRSYRLVDLLRDKPAATHGKAGRAKS